MGIEGWGYLSVSRTDQSNDTHNTPPPTVATLDPIGMPEKKLSKFRSSAAYFSTKINFSN